MEKQKTNTLEELQKVKDDITPKDKTHEEKTDTEKFEIYMRATSNYVKCYYCKGAWGTLNVKRHPDTGKKIKTKDGKSVYEHPACHENYVREQLVTQMVKGEKAREAEEKANTEGAEEE
jgi:hypothetical protein